MIIPAIALPMKRSFPACTFVLLCAALVAPSSALALNGVSIEAGRGDHQTNLLRVGVQWQGHRKAFEQSSWHIAHYIDLAVGGWNGEHGTVYDLGVTPVFRFERASRSPYIEAAVGFHVISERNFKGDVETGTRFQFGDHIGIGIVRGRYDIGLRLQHLSNAGIRNPNPGINFLQLRLQYSLD
jgi:lipid A 3-O-deacylase